MDLAMKQPKEEVFQTEKQKDSFISECEAWINLGLHPHIVSCYYVREIGGIPAIFSEWMDGGSLKNIIEDGSLYGDGAEERILDIAIQFARGLHYTHEQGLIHQDVKPDNLLLTKTGEAKVADFGIAKARISATVLDTNMPYDATMFSVSGGYTPAYASIEQVRGGKLTRRTDIYSWAVSVVEMYLGERRWTDGVIVSMACENYFSEARVAVPKAMQALLKECLNMEEEKRPHDFSVVEQRLLGIYRDTFGIDYNRTQPKAAADTADSLNNRALSFLDIGKPQEAEKYWKKALSLDPNHVESVYNLSLKLWRSGKICDLDAVRSIEACMQNNWTWKGYYCLAKVHLERGDKEKAASILERMSGNLGIISNNDSIKERLAGDKLLTQLRAAPKKGAKALGDRYEAYAVCFDPKGMNVLIASNAVKIWNVDTGECIQTFKGQTWDTNCVQYSPDGKLALLGDENGTLKLYDVNSGECLRTFKDDSWRRVRSVCFSPDASLVISGGNGVTVKLWNVKTGECLNSFNAGAFVHSVAVSNDGKIRIWDMNSGACLRTLSGHTGSVNAVCIDPTNSLVLSGSSDKTARLWDIKTGDCLHIYTDSSDGIQTVCFDPNGKYILTGSIGPSLKLWDRHTGVCLHTFPVESGINSACFSPDGSRVIAGTFSGCNLYHIPDFDYKAE